MKRAVFVGLSLLLAAISLGLFYINVNSKYWVLFVFIVVSAILSMVFAKYVLRNNSFLVIIVLPVALVAGFGSVSLFFPNLNIYFRGLFFLAAAVSFYVTFLTLNVFTVVLTQEEVHVPLLRAAVTVASLLFSLTLFLIYTIIYKYSTIFAIQSAIIFIITFLLNRFYFWSATLETPVAFEKEAFMSALIVFEVSLGLSFLPIEAFFRGFALVGVVYVINGILLGRLKHTLTRKVQLEYGAVLLFVLALLLVFNF